MVRYAPLFLLSLFAALSIGSMAGEAPTGDEVAHLPAGYTYVKTGDLRLNRQHPPLIKALAGLPLLLLDLKPVEQSPGWAEGDEWRFGRDFLVDNRTPRRTIVFCARLPMVTVGLLLCWLVFAWARDLWGGGPALFALALCALSPNLLAHTPLVTTDVGVTAFTVLALYPLWRFSHSGRLADVAVAAFGVGSALLAKYSGVLTAALALALLPAAWYVRRREARDGDASHTEAPPNLRRLFAAALLLVLIPAAMVTVGFGFPHGLTNYVQGVRLVHADRNPYWQGFLWGRYSPSGFWYYYLLAQWWKTPLPTLLSFAAALFLVPFRNRSASALRRWADWLFVLLPFAAFHLAGMAYHASIGVRHILPAYPFMFIAAAATAAWVRHRSVLPKAVFAALCLWLAAGTLRAYPHFLAYFNEFTGGPENGIFYLDDSNIEWGQDLDRLARYIEKTKPATARLSAFKAFRPEYYGIRAEFMSLRDVVWPQPGVTYFAGLSYLQRNSLYNDYPGVRFRWLERYRPVDRVGRSIGVFRFSTEPRDAGRTDVFYIDRARWYAQAIEDLTAMLARSPRFHEARRVLARVYEHRARWHEARGDGQAALADFARAARVLPAPPYRAALRGAVDRWAPSVRAPSGEPASHLYLLAFLADRAGRAGEALRLYLQCIERAPRHLGAHFNLGQLYARLGLPAAARREWQACLQIAPGYAPARQSLQATERLRP